MHFAVKNRGIVTEAETVKRFLNLHVVGFLEVWHKQNCTQPLANPPESILNAWGGKMKVRVRYEETASQDTDAQNGFTELCKDELPVNEGHLIVDELNAQAMFAFLRVGSGDWHPLNGEWETENPALVGQEIPNASRNVDRYWTRHCIADTFGADQIEGLPRQGEYDFFVRKGQSPGSHPYGAAFDDLHGEVSTGLIEYLKAKGVTTVIKGGLALDFCVATSAKQLRSAGFRVIVNLAATRGIFEDGCKAAIEEMKDLGIEFVDSAADLELI